MPKGAGPAPVPDGSFGEAPNPEAVSGLELKDSGDGGGTGSSASDSDRSVRAAQDASALKGATKGAGDSVNVGQNQTVGQHGQPPAMTGEQQAIKPFAPPPVSFGK